MKLPPIAPPEGLKSHQLGYWWTLFWALLEAGGYLPFGSDLWKLTGALTRERWDANRSAVLAAFEFTEPDASGRRDIFYPPLIKIIEQQKGKYRRRSRDQLGISEVSTAIHKGGRSISPSVLQSDFDFDSKDQNQIQKHSSARVSRYTQDDFNARDLRRLKEAGDKFDRMRDSLVGGVPAWMQNEKQVYEWLCAEAGITVERGLELERIQKKWPEKSKFAAAGD